jgi:hypothetical protein
MIGMAILRLVGVRSMRPPAFMRHVDGDQEPLEYSAVPACAKMPSLILGQDGQ